jgi:hypothetical protein
MQGVITRLPLRMTEDGLELSVPLRIGELSDARTLEAVGMYLPTRLNVGRDKREWLQGAFAVRREVVTAADCDAAAT